MRQHFSANWTDNGDNLPVVTVLNVDRDRYREIAEISRDTHFSR